MPPSATYDRWVWHTTGSGAPSACKREFDRLPEDVQGRLSQRMSRFLSGECGRRDVDNLGDGILELRVKLGSNPYRLLFCIRGRTCVALTAFHKKDQKTPKKDLDRAKQRRDSWRGE